MLLGEGVLVSMGFLEVRDFFELDGAEWAEVLGMDSCRF